MKKFLTFYILLVLFPVVFGYETVSGTLEIMHIDSNISNYEYFLNTTTGAKQLVFESVPPPNIAKQLHTGAQIKVVGQQINESNKNEMNFVVNGGLNLTPDTAPLPQSQSYNVLVVPVNFQDQQFECSKNDIQSIMTKVHDLYGEASYGQMNIQIEMHNPVTISDRIGDGCEYLAWRDEVVKRIGDVSGYRSVLMTFPRPDNSPSTCPFSGVGDVEGSPAYAWVLQPRGYCQNPGMTAQLYGHELGHNFGMGHANSIKFEDGATIRGEYEDRSDIMGGGGVVQTNGPHRYRTGWLSPTVITTGTYVLQALETSQSVLELKTPIRKENTYFSYRVPVGFDNNLPSTETKKLHIHLFDDSNMHAATYQVATLDVGEHYQDPFTFIKVDVLEKTDQQIKFVVSQDRGREICNNGIDDDDNGKIDYTGGESPDGIPDSEQCKISFTDMQIPETVKPHSSYTATCFVQEEKSYVPWLSANIASGGGETGKTITGLGSYQTTITAANEGVQVLECGSGKAGVAFTQRFRGTVHVLGENCGGMGEPACDGDLCLPGLARCAAASNTCQGQCDSCGGHGEWPCRDKIPFYCTENRALCDDHHCWNNCKSNVEVIQ